MLALMFAVHYCLALAIDCCLGFLSLRYALEWSSKGSG
jgi:hypothetical protein